MAYCLNPSCRNCLNPDEHNCQSCGSQLLVRNRYPVIKPIGGEDLSEPIRQQIWVSSVKVLGKVQALAWKDKISCGQNLDTGASSYVLPQTD
jgi:DNA-directed RNA polymerase subunit RPC12/RpoP